MACRHTLLVLCFIDTVSPLTLQCLVRFFTRLSTHKQTSTIVSEDLSEVVAAAGGNLALQLYLFHKVLMLRASEIRTKLMCAQKSWKFLRSMATKPAHTHVHISGDRRADVLN